MLTAAPCVLGLPHLPWAVLWLQKMQTSKCIESWPVCRNAPKVSALATDSIKQEHV